MTRFRSPQCAQRPSLVGRNKRKGFFLGFFLFLSYGTENETVSYSLLVKNSQSLCLNAAKTLEPLTAGKLAYLGRLTLVTALLLGFSRKTYIMQTCRLSPFLRILPGIHFLPPSWCILRTAYTTSNSCFYDAARVFPKVSSCPWRAWRCISPPLRSWLRGGCGNSV